MKKLVALTIALILCLSCFTAAVFAEENPDFKVCIDFIQSRKDPCLDKDNFFENPEVEDLDKNVATAGGKYKLKNSKAKYLFFEGWISTDYEYKDEDTSIGTRVDGGEITWTSEADYNLNPGNTYHDFALRTFVNILICKGTHHVEVLARVEEEAEPVLIFEFDYEAEFGEEIVVTPVPDPTEVPVTEAPKATEVPATEAPKATEVPATEVPKATEVPATEAPKATEETKTAEESDKGGSPVVFIVIGAAVVVIAVVAVILVKKKK